tara:strand:+ start:1003 stop:1347 length:345 start_codon:yes stop_codon:yes gene_type:complete
MSKGKVKGTADAWEAGELGQDERHAKLSDLKMEDLDDALALQMISIRIQKELLDDLKTLAQYHGIGYQPLMKQVLRRFADAEMRKIARNAMSAATGRKGKAESDSDEDLQVACG